MKISLPDVNVFLALIAAGHIHHTGARGWFETRDVGSVGICRVTQMGLLRLLTNPKVLPGGEHAIQRAWDIMIELLSDKRVFFEYEPRELETAWEKMMRHPSAGRPSWTDAYLAAFAQQHGYELVTFDKGFRRWADLTQITLVQA